MICMLRASEDDAAQITCGCLPEQYRIILAPTVCIGQGAEVVNFLERVAIV